MGKQSRLPFKASKTRSNNILDVIHADLCGGMEVMSIGGARYFLTFIDDFSRKTFIYFLKSKKEVRDKFIEFNVWAKNQFGRSIKNFPYRQRNRILSKTNRSSLCGKWHPSSTYGSIHTTAKRSRRENE